MCYYAININRTWEGSSGGAVVIIRLASHQCGLSLIRKITHKELINILKQYILNLTGRLKGIRSFGEDRKIQ